MEQKSIHIKFPDGKIKTFNQGITSLEIAQTLGERYAKKFLAAYVNGEIWDLTRPIHQDATLQLLSWEEADGKKTFWHSSAHLLAEALEALYPGIQFGIGPPIANGFYYDIDFGDYTFDASHLVQVEKKILELAQQQHPFRRIPIAKQPALQFFEEKGDPYKIELAQALTDGQITFYQQGNFTDLCRGPHLPHTGFIKAVKLLNIAGAYWRGNEKNKQLTRIYGITFPEAKALKVYLHQRAEAQKRNHQKIGQALKLFTFSDKVGIGLPLWLPRGAILREQLEQFLGKKQRQNGYQPVITPHIGHKRLYMTSGHYEKYGADSFQPIHTPHPGEAFLLKPMNCPHHCEIYQAEPRSYRDLPLRLAEFGTVYRYEQHGELHGLARTRGFTQDDAHIFCRPDQVQEEVTQVLHLVDHILRHLNFPDYTIRLSFRDPNQTEKYIGHADDWALAEQAIAAAAQKNGLTTSIGIGEAAFYGPKIDFLVRDALDRTWQLGTIQLDYQLPKRFDLTYMGTDNQPHRPVMIHRAPFGSLERFIAILLEHTNGNLPFWLAPEQVIVLPISEKYAAYAENVYKTLQDRALRSTIDHRDEKIGKKIRDAETMKIPYMLIVGEKEQIENTVAVRKHGAGDQGCFSLNNLFTHFFRDIP